MDEVDVSTVEVVVAADALGIENKLLKRLIATAVILTFLYEVFFNTYTSGTEYLNLTLTALVRAVCHNDSPNQEG
jgi:hypothetical protein